MRLGQFVSFGLGGADRAAYCLCKGLRELGVDVTVIYNTGCLPGPNDPSRFSRYASFPVHRIQHVRELRDYGLSVLNTHRSGDDTWLLPDFEATDFPFKVVETNHHGFCASKADIRVFPSRTMVAFRRPTGRYTVIPNPTFPPLCSDDLRGALGLAGKFVFGRIGRPDGTVCSDVSLRAYKSIEDESTAFLYVAPTEDIRRRAAELKLRSIIFLEPVLEDEMLSMIYNTFDVLCHSNPLGETFGNTVAEAMIHGRPVVSHAGGPGWPQAQTELLGDVVQDLYVPRSGDQVSPYAGVMRRLRDDGAFYRETSEYLSGRAATLFHYLSVAKKYMEVYGEVS